MFFANQTEVPEQIEYCGITATQSLWQAVGLATGTYSDGRVEFPRPYQSYGLFIKPATDGELIEARITTGETGEKALVWLIAERRRQAEERARTQASEVLAAAQKKAGDDAIHAARIHRQAEELRCLAAGIDGRAITARLR